MLKCFHSTRILTQQNNLRFAANFSDKDISRVRVRVHKTGVKNLLGKNAQQVRVNIGQGHAVIFYDITLRHFDPVDKFGGENSLTS